MENPSFQSSITNHKPKERPLHYTEYAPGKQEIAQRIVAHPPGAALFCFASLPVCFPFDVFSPAGLSYITLREPHQTREPWHLSCHGGKPPANHHVPRAPLRAQRRAVRGQGVLPLVRAMRPIAEWRSMLCTKQGTTPDPRGPSPSSGKTPAKPHVPRTPPRPKGAVWGAGRREEDTRRVVHGTTRSAFGRLNFSNKI